MNDKQREQHYRDMFNNLTEEQFVSRMMELLPTTPTPPNIELREAFTNILKKTYYNARTDVVAEKNGVVPKSSPHATGIIENQVNDLLELTLATALEAIPYEEGGESTGRNYRTGIAKGWNDCRTQTKQNLIEAFRGSRND